MTRAACRVASAVAPTLAAPTLAALALAACGAEERAVPPDTTSDGAVRVVASAGATTAPDTVDAGWTRLRVEEDGAGHVVTGRRL